MRDISIFLTVFIALPLIASALESLPDKTLDETMGMTITVCTTAAQDVIESLAMWQRD